MRPPRRGGPGSRRAGQATRRPWRPAAGAVPKEPCVRRTKCLQSSLEVRLVLRLSDHPEIAGLSTEEKILLVEDLWDSIAANESAVPVPQSHRDELDRRLAEYRPEGLLSLDELRRRLEGL
ncbi:MAG: addiction module protein [Armatimonadetes bacterium]|nr:addiction module protein [Armatimonadota bacterium]